MLTLPATVCWPSTPTIDIIQARTKKYLLPPRSKVCSQSPLAVLNCVLFLCAVVLFERGFLSHNYLCRISNYTYYELSSFFADQSLITIELNNLREKWNKVENDVRRKRRAFRNWYRDNKNFAMECCPELFHYLPDFRTPGSILGDGGFADMAKVLF